MGLTHKQRWNRRHGFPRDEGHSLHRLARVSGVPRGVLQTVYDRGIGAYRTNPTSVRLRGSFAKNPSPRVPLARRLSKEQWAVARVYAFINKLEEGGPAALNHDRDLLPRRPPPSSPTPADSAAVPSPARRRTARPRSGPGSAETRAAPPPRRTT